MSQVTTHRTDTGLLTIVSSLKEPFVSMIYECYQSGAIYSTMHNGISLGLISKIFEKDPMMVNHVIENMPRVWLGNSATGVFLEFVHVIDNKHHIIWFNMPVIRNLHKL